MTRPGTVVVVMPAGTRRGGAELSLTQLLRWSSPDVAWTVVFLEDGDLVREVRAAGISTRVVAAGRLRQPRQFAQAVVRLVRIIRATSPDLVVGWMTKGHLYAGLAALLTRRPAVWYQLGTARSSNAIDRLAMAIPARKVLTVSQDTKAVQARLRPARPVDVVYPGADLDEFDPDLLPSPPEARRQLGLPATGPMVGMVGRLQHWKGFHVLIDAMPDVLRSTPAAVCVLVGGTHPLEPGYEQSLRERAQRLGVADRIVFAGYQPNSALWMQAMDVVVHASDCEPFGLVVVEAMSLGKPVVAGSRGGPREIIRAEIDGLLVDFGDHRGLAEAVLRYVQDPPFAAQTGARARARARAFSAQRYAKSLVEAISTDD